MALTFPDFQPDQLAVIPINSYGIPIVFQVRDDKGNIVNLTNVQSIELELKHKTDNNVAKISMTGIKSDALAGLAYAITIPNQFTVVGSYKPSPILYYASSTDFPNGRKIPAYISQPTEIEVTD